MLKTAIIGLGRGSKVVSRNQKVRGLLEKRIEVICPLENVQTISTSISRKNMALEVRKELKENCLVNVTKTKEQDLWVWNTNSDEVYCDYAMYMFTACLVAMTWTFVLLGVLCFLYIWYGRQSLKKFDDK